MSAEKTSSPVPLVKALEALSQRCVPLLLFDETENLSNAFWRAWEVNILGPLLQTNRILVVISSRRRATYRRRVEIRRRANSEAVEPFSIQALQDQFDALGPPLSEQSVEQLYNLSCGNPQLAYNLWLAQVEPEKEQMVESALPILRAYEEMALKEIAHELRGYIYLLAPPRFYRMEALLVMLEKLRPSQGEPTGVALFGELRRLSDTEVVWWAEEKNAYITAPILRQVINHRQLLSESNKFRRQHRFALNMYQEWAKTYPESKPAYLPEILYHQRMLDLTGESESESLTDLDRFVELISKMEPEDRKALEERLEPDREFRRLLTPRSYERLWKAVTDKPLQTQ